MGEKPVAIVLPSWNPNEPRFIVEDCPQCGDDRQFKNGKVVFNQRLKLAYSVDEIVEVLNASGDFNDGARDFIRKTYLNIKNADDEIIFSKDQLLNLFKTVADDLEVDLKEYPKISLNDIINDDQKKVH